MQLCTQKRDQKTAQINKALTNKHYNKQFGRLVHKATLDKVLTNNHYNNHSLVNHQSYT